MGRVDLVCPAGSPCRQVLTRQILKPPPWHFLPHGTLWSKNKWMLVMVEESPCQTSQLKRAFIWKKRWLLCKQLSRIPWLPHLEQIDPAERAKEEKKREKLARIGEWPYMPSRAIHLVEPTSVSHVNSSLRLVSAMYQKLARPVELGWAICLNIYLFVLFFCLLLHRLAVRISLLFHIFLQV